MSATAVSQAEDPNQNVQISYPAAYMPPTLTGRSDKPFNGLPPPAYYPPGLPSPAYDTPPRPIIQPDNSCRYSAYFCFVLVVLSIFICSSDIVLLSIKPKIPILKIDSLHVPIFNVNGAQLIAHWVANFTIENPNDLLKLNVEETDVYAFYNINNLAWTNLPSYILEPRQKLYKLSAELDKKRKDGFEMETLVVQKLGQERKTTRELIFRVRIDVFATYKANSLSRKRMYIRYCCKDIVVIFEGETGPGMFTGSRKCGLDEGI